MNRYEVRIAPAAERQILKLPRTVQRRIVAKLTALETSPRGPDCKKLSGSDFWRTRVGSYRLVYLINDAELIVLVVRVGDRKDIYR